MHKEGSLLVKEIISWKGGLLMAHSSFSIGYRSSDFDTMVVRN